MQETVQKSTDIVSSVNMSGRGGLAMGMDISICDMTVSWVQVFLLTGRCMKIN